MVIGYFFGAAHLLRQNITGGFYAINSGSAQDDCRDASLHIVRQIAAVRPGIGTKLLFIEGLEIIQSLLGGIAQKPVLLLVRQ